MEFNEKTISKKDKEFIEFLDRKIESYINGGNEWEKERAVAFTHCKNKFKLLNRIK